MPQVLKRKGLYGKIPEGAVYVGRPSRWGNPYKIGMPGIQSRFDAIQAFVNYAERRAEEDPTWLLPLRGKDLVCHCAPLACHADIVLILANQKAEGRGQALYGPNEDCTVGQVAPDAGGLGEWLAQHGGR